MSLRGRVFFIKLFYGFHVSGRGKVIVNLKYDEYYLLTTKHIFAVALFQKGRRHCLCFFVCLFVCLFFFLGQNPGCNSISYIER